MAGIFDDKVDIYDVYHAKLQFRNWVVGGQPKNVKAIREMYMRRFGVSGEDMIRQELVRLIVEESTDKEVPFNPEDLKNMSIEALEAAADKVAARSVNGFNQDDHGLYLGSYQVKAGFREMTNIAFAGEKWGATKEGCEVISG